MSTTCYREPRKESLRLPRFDYTSPGFYYITICTKNRECFFGNIENQKMTFSDIGKFANENWKMLPEFFPDVQLDEYIIMPNHIHGIIKKLPLNRETINTEKWKNQTSRKPTPLKTIIGLYKSRCTRIINRIQHEAFFAWQPKYYDHVIENEGSLNRVREYIKLNPIKWSEDKHNPNNFDD